MQGIVVGISESATGAAALDWALQQAVLRKVPLTVIRAWEIPSVGGYYSVGAALRSTSPDFELGELSIAEEALAKSCARVPGAEAVETTAVATRGRPPQVLVEAAKDAELLVVGSRGIGALSRVVHLGSVTSSALHHATGPVAVIHENPPQQPRHAPRVVVGVDDSPRSRHALLWAVEHARLSGGVLVPLTVHTERRGDHTGDQVAERSALADAANAAGAGTGEPVTVEPALRSGSAAAELIAASAEADVLVMGTRGRGGFASLLLGSTTMQVAGHAACPVVVVRSD